MICRGSGHADPLLRVRKAQALMKDGLLSTSNPNWERLPLGEECGSHSSGRTVYVRRAWSVRRYESDWYDVSSPRIVHRNIWGTRNKNSAIFDQVFEIEAVVHDTSRVENDVAAVKYVHIWHLIALPRAADV